MYIQVPNPLTEQRLNLPISDVWKKKYCILTYVQSLIDN